MNSNSRTRKGPAVSLNSLTQYLPKKQEQNWMLVQGVDLPEELLRAQAAGDLVIFIGAGVSAPPPASLPLFDELAQQVGEGTVLQRRENESVDSYFGRLKIAGVEVHRAVARILLNPASQPHELHTLLTKLFPAGEPVRLVTTNFDTHLSTTLKQTADLLLIYFSAPNLHVYADDTLQNIWRALVQAKLPPEHLRKVREAIFRFGPDPNEWT